MPDIRRFRTLAGLLAATTLLAALPASMARAQSKSPTPARAIDRDDDDGGPDQPGQDDALNRALWERMKHTPYEVALARVARAHQDQQGPAASGATVMLPNGWRLAPAGIQVPVGRLPYEAVPFAGKIVVLGNGYYTGDEKPEITVVDPESHQVQTLTVPSAKDALYPSAVVGADGDLYVSGGNARKIFRFNSRFELVETYTVDGYAAGLAPIDATHLAVTYLLTGDETPMDTDDVGINRKGRLAVLNTTLKKVGASQPIGFFPAAIRLVRGKLYVALQGEDRVAVYTPRLDLLTTIPVGRSPQDIAVDGDRLYVVNANSDTLSVIDAARDTVAETIDLRPDSSRFGNAPTSCAIDGDRLYVTLANINAVAVLDKQTGRRLGSIPTGWYPTKTLVQGDRLFVVSAKGIKLRRPNPDGPQPISGKGGSRYVLTVLQGSLGIVPKDAIASHLEEWTRAVQASHPLHGVPGKGLPPIRHIFYIVRENRTYDQVLGDLGRGNGDPALTLFGADFTPNAHKIARDFVTLDNYFADGEISVLGHSFTTSGYASPLLQWVANTTYSGRLRGYPFGTVPAVTSPAYLWDALDAWNVDYRIYGENYFLYTRAYGILTRFYGPDSELAKKFYAQSMALSSVTDRGNRFYRFASPYYGRAQTPEAALALLEKPDFTQGLSQFLVGDNSLATALAENRDLRQAFAEYLCHYPFQYRSWDTATSDMDRARAWIDDFNDQVRRQRVAPLHYIWLPNDHTGGKLAPEQMVSQNDAALGRILETISHSPVWSDSLVLITEDDAQNGPDHVDATRTVGLALGPYVRRGAVISDRYDQLSLLRTIGMLLGLPPLNRDDALAVPMYSLFADHPDLRPYTPTQPSKHLTLDDRQKYEALSPAAGQ